jgi:hypothetical protein
MPLPQFGRERTGCRLKIRPVCLSYFQTLLTATVSQ